MEAYGSRRRIVNKRLNDWTEILTLNGTLVLRRPGELVQSRMRDIVMTQLNMAQSLQAAIIVIPVSSTLRPTHAHQYTLVYSPARVQRYPNHYMDDDTCRLCGGLLGITSIRVHPAMACSVCRNNDCCTRCVIRWQSTATLYSPVAPNIRQGHLLCARCALVYPALVFGVRSWTEQLMMAAFGKLEVTNAPHGVTFHFATVMLVHAETEHDIEEVD